MFSLAVTQSSRSPGFPTGSLGILAILSLVAITVTAIVAIAVTAILSRKTFVKPEGGQKDG
jgi:hypothetical protein